MDVIVTWRDGSTNCVCINELRPVRKYQRITLGTKVKMYYQSKWYYGTVTVIESEDGNLNQLPTEYSSPSSVSNSSDNIPLSCIANYEANSEQNICKAISGTCPNDSTNIVVSNVTIELECENDFIYEEKPCSTVQEQNNNKEANDILEKNNSEDKIMPDINSQLNQNSLDQKKINKYISETETTSNVKSQVESSITELQINVAEVEINNENIILNMEYKAQVTPSNSSNISDDIVRENELLSSVLVDMPVDETDDDALLSRIAKSFIKPLEVEKSTQNTDNLDEPIPSHVESMDYEDADTYCPSNRSSLELFEDISDLNDPDYEPVRNKRVNTKFTIPDVYISQTCEAVNCDQNVFSSCCHCTALLCWVHFEEDILPCTMHGSTNSDSIPKQSLLQDSSNCDKLIPQTCEVGNCREEVRSSCFRCSALLCWQHFEENNPNCTIHGPKQNKQVLRDISSKQSINKDIQDMEMAYSMEGSMREFIINTEQKVNKRKSQKELRNTGQEYISRTKKIIPAKQLGPSCNLEVCKRMNRKCADFSDEHRKEIHAGFYTLGNVEKQREFIARHVIETVPKQRTTQDRSSRRNRSLHYYLVNNGMKVKVCRKFFLNTLSISEKIVRTALDKVDSSTGFLDKEGRGGRRQDQVEKDLALRSIVEQHIRRFPRVESHYCRENSSREYLHPDLSQKKMYRLLLEEKPDPVPSLTLYKTVFKEMRLSFHRPKKDQCSLCATYKTAQQEEKDKLKDKYTAHAIEKMTVRSKKKEDKNNASEDTTLRCSTFDLQQVIFLPISNESAIFYKRRLSVYNFTIYDLNTRNCICFIWPETESKRGSSEISTALTMYLKDCDDAIAKVVNMYADGCAGQNKNSIVASALLYFINRSENIETVSLKFFTPNHGQSEGDSAHSAISYALKKDGDVFTHTQLYPIIRSARPSQPYEVRPLEYKDFKDYKQLSKSLKILSLRKDNETNMSINWTDIVEIKVEKENPTSIFFKTSHADTTYRSISLKRTDTKYLGEEIQPLNQAKIKISSAKYQDLMSLCSGETPVIRLEEYKKYYENLPHE